MVKVSAMPDVAVKIQTESGVLSEYAKHDEPDTPRRTARYVMLEEEEQFMVTISGDLPGDLQVDHVLMEVLIDGCIEDKSIHSITKRGRGIWYNVDGFDTDATTRSFFKFTRLSVGDHSLNDHSQSSKYQESDTNSDTSELGCIHIKLSECHNVRETNDNDDNDSQAFWSYSLTTSLPATSVTDDAPSHYVGVSGSRTTRREEYDHLDGDQGALLAHYKLYYRDKATLWKMGINIDEPEKEELEEHTEDEDVDDGDMVHDPMEIEDTAAAESETAPYALPGQLSTLAYRPKQR